MHIVGYFQLVLFLTQNLHMKRIFQLSVLIFAVLLCFNNDAFAQRKKKKKKSETDEYFDESGGFAHRLWYGGNVIVGFNGGTNGFGLNESIFTLGLTPMVGYKITDYFSVGPRFTILYQYYRGEIAPGVADGINLTSYGAGVFSRFKFFREFFVHGEYEYLEQAFIADLRDGEWVSGTFAQDNIYFGAGYNSNAGGAFGYEILILYNFNIPDNVVRNPFDFRLGFTYNF